jgi:hypothetical protein
VSRANSRVHEPYGLTETGGLWATGGLTGSGSHVALSFCQSATLDATSSTSRALASCPATRGPPGRPEQPAAAPSSFPGRP